MHRSDLDQQLTLVEVKPGWTASLGSLIDMLPTTEDVLFFGQVFDLDYMQLSNLMRLTHTSDVAQALFGQGQEHSTTLQDYVVDTCSAHFTSHEMGRITYSNSVPAGEILPDVWRSLEVEVADSIKQVGAKLAAVVERLPGKQGAMMFQTMRVMNAKRPTIGDYRAVINHPPQKQNLVILDVSGSVSRGTVEKLVDDVVAMSYLANAHFAIVSNSTTYWEPGTYDSTSILEAAEFGGTCYETLSSVLNEDWGTVVTIADYDSSWSAKETIRQYCTGTIDEVLDISLVNRPTFLAECVGQLAGNTRPLLVASGEDMING